MIVDANATCGVELEFDVISFNFIPSGVIFAVPLPTFTIVKLYNLPVVCGELLCRLYTLFFPTCIHQMQLPKLGLDL